ncbi:lysozyme inhibitor LprI family protein [Roseateles sp.]|uniref:lysozyme inhibitor LprI family protein n=1 Tax=Roseateles sp. TaxID=1971397 RepID=UPI0031D2B467
MKLLSVVGSTLLAVVGQTVFAAPQAACVDSKNTPELNACLADEVAAQSKRVDSLYESKLKRIQGFDATRTVDRSAPLLVESQNRWRSFVSADCAAQASLYSPGTGVPMFESRCLLKAYADRIETLSKNYFSD